MGLMTDTDLRSLLQKKEIMEVAQDADLMKQVHGTAIEMRIGEIFRPGSPSHEPGSADYPRESYALLEGETAVVRTLESFKLDAQHTAIVLPVGSVSLQGLLMTNPGHVDPGYKGKVHVTVINMGRQAYALRKGDRLLRALVFKLEKTVATPYTSSATGPAAPTPPQRPQFLQWILDKLDGFAPRRSTGPVTQELLETLSPDFLSVGARAAHAAKREIESALRINVAWQLLLPAILGAAAAWITAWASNHSLSDKLDHRLSDIEAQHIESRLESLEGPTAQRLNTLEDSVRKLQHPESAK